MGTPLCSRDGVRHIIVANVLESLQNLTQHHSMRIKQGPQGFLTLLRVTAAPPPLQDISTYLFATGLPALIFNAVFYIASQFTALPESNQYRAEHPQVYSIASFLCYQTLRDCFLASLSVLVFLPGLPAVGMMR